MDSKNKIIEDSKITEHGEIKPKFLNLKLKLKKEKEKEKKVLILGNGYVIPPIIKFFEGKPNVKITIGTLIPEENKNKDWIEVIKVDVLSDEKLLSSLIQSSDIVIR